MQKYNMPTNTDHQFESLDLSKQSNCSHIDLINKKYYKFELKKSFLGNESKRRKRKKKYLRAT